MKSGHNNMEDNQRIERKSEMTNSKPRKNQGSERIYWKDALQQMQKDLGQEVVTGQNHKWQRAYQQAQADMADPSAVVWLPDEIVEVLHQTQTKADTDQARPTGRKLPLKVWLAGIALGLLLPTLSFIRAYRRLKPHHL